MKNVSLFPIAASFCVMKYDTEMSSASFFSKISFSINNIQSYVNTLLLNGLRVNRILTIRVIKYNTNCEYLVSLFL